MNQKLFAAVALALIAGCANQPETKPVTTYHRASGQPFLGIMPVDDEPVVRTTSEERVVQPGELAKKVAIDPIYFELDRADLSADARTKLLNLATWMKSNPDVAIRVEGFTDPSGTVAHNKVLGAKRAQALRSDLAGRGVSADRIRTVNRGGEPVERKAVITVLAE